MHAALRAALAQAVTWAMIDRSPAIGVKLPKKRAVKPPVFADVSGDQARDRASAGADGDNRDPDRVRFDAHWRCASLE